MVKEALAELLNEMLMFKDLMAGSFSQPGPVGAGQSLNQPVTREPTEAVRALVLTCKGKSLEPPSPKGAQAEQRCAS